MYYEVRNYRGIDIIPSEDIPSGYKRTTEKAIYVSPRNYELLKPLSAKGTIIALGFLKEIERKNDAIESD